MKARKKDIEIDICVMWPSNICLLILHIPTSENYTKAL